MEDPEVWCALNCLAYLGRETDEESSEKDYRVLLVTLRVGVSQCSG